jgi:hypothetical protein
MRNRPKDVASPENGDSSSTDFGMKEQLEKPSTGSDMKGSRISSKLLDRVRKPKTLDNQMAPGLQPSSRPFTLDEFKSLVIASSANKNLLNNPQSQNLIVRMYTEAQYLELGAKETEQKARRTSVGTVFRTVRAPTITAESFGLICTTYGLLPVSVTYA